MYAHTGTVLRIHLESGSVEQESIERYRDSVGRRGVNQRNPLAFGSGNCGGIAAVRRCSLGAILGAKRLKAVVV